MFSLMLRAGGPAGPTFYAEKKKRKRWPAGVQTITVQYRSNDIWRYETVSKEQQTGSLSNAPPERAPAPVIPEIRDGGGGRENPFEVTEPDMLLAVFFKHFNRL